MNNDDIEPETINFLGFKFTDSNRLKYKNTVIKVLIISLDLGYKNKT